MWRIPCFIDSWYWTDFRGIVWSLLLLAGLGMLLGPEYAAVGGIASQLFLEKRSGVFALPSAVIEGRASSKKLLH